MSGLVGDTKRVALIAVVLLALIVAAQGLATQAEPSNRASTGEVIGRTGFAYLGGLRTFAAAVLWNHIDPQFHDYYAGIPLAEQTYMIPTLRLIVALDPQFTQAYYLSAWIVYKHSPAEGLAIAREGVANNPRSGIMRANLAQILFIEGKDANREEIIEHAQMGLAPGAEWLDDVQKYEGTAIMMQALIALGETQTAQIARETLEELKASDAVIGDHDHDADGKQDH